jgi:hypothetical protein
VHYRGKSVLFKTVHVDVRQTTVRSGAMFQVWKIHRAWPASFLFFLFRIYLESNRLNFR